MTLTMTKLALDQIRRRLERLGLLRQEYEQKLRQLGRLKRHEAWSYAYLVHPYLIGAPESRIADRFSNIFMNAMELSREGKISPVDFSVTDTYMEVFTHILEEYNTRGGVPFDVAAAARAPMLKYFEHGTPIGITLFDGYLIPSAPILVKYGKRRFLEPLLRTGDIRLANASMYNNSGFLSSVRDDETSRTFFIPTYRERLSGLDYIVFEGNRIDLNDEDIELPVVFDDYYLFSLCEHIHYRMPTDFDADAAIVIRDPIRFKQQLISTFLARLPDWEVMEGPVTYYDPYRDYNKFNVPEMVKHFGYAYQKEVRVAFRPRVKPRAPLEPLHLSIGSMTDYADLLFV